MGYQKQRLISDEPIGIGVRSDSLGFEKYSRALSGFARNTPGPFTFGIYAKWGYGKTSLLRSIQKDLDINTSKTKKIITVRFDAWQYESDEYPLIALITVIKTEVEAHVSANESLPKKVREEANKVAKSLSNLCERFISSTKVGLKTPAGLVSPLEINIEFDGKELVKSSKKSSNPTHDIELAKSQYYEAFRELGKICSQSSKYLKIVVFIDDLDRCLPKQAFALLETIKLVLSQPNFLFFLAVDYELMQTYINRRYQKEYGIGPDDAGKFYLDKLVQVPFDIPTHENRIGTFVDDILNPVYLDKKEMLKDILLVLGSTVSYNPRAIVRMVNTILLLDEIDNNSSQADKGNDMIIFFAMEVVLRMYYPKLHEHLHECSPDVLEELCDDSKPKNKEAIEAWKLLETKAYSEIKKILRDTDKSYGLRWLDSNNAQKRERAWNLTTDRQVETIGNTINYEDSLIPAQLAYVAHDYRRAIVFLRNSIKVDPNNPELYYLRGKSHFRLMQWEDAKNDFEMTLELNPMKVTTFKYYGHALRRLNLYEDALYILTAAAIDFPDSPEIRIALGTVRYRGPSRDYVGAIDEFDEAEHLGSRDTELFYRRADARYQKAGQKPDRVEIKKIENDIRKVLKRNPSDSRTLKLQNKINDHLRHQK